MKRVKAEGEETLFVFRQTVNEAYIHEKHSFSILKHDVPSASLCVSSCSDYSSCEWVRAAAVWTLGRFERGGAWSSGHRGGVAQWEIKGVLGFPGIYQDHIRSQKPVWWQWLLLPMQDWAGSPGFSGGVSITPDLITGGRSKNSRFQLIQFNTCADRKRGRGFPGIKPL